MACCQEHHSCGDVGNSIVQYGDVLSEAVAKHEMTEAQAKHKFVEFKAKQAMEVHTVEPQAAAASAASGPTACNRIGTTTTC
jgi:hypothetical protein